MATAALAERFDAGRAVARAAAIFRAHAGLLAALAVALELAPSLIIELAVPGAVGASGRTGTGFSRLGFGYFGGAGLIGLLIACVAIGAMLYVATTGDPTGFVAAVRRGLRRALPMLGLFIVLYVAILFGMIFLIVPGIILGVMWSVSAAVLVAEGTGVFASLGRSRALTKGSRWAVLLMLAALLVVYMLLFGVAALVSGGLDPVVLASTINGFGVVGIGYRVASTAMSVVTTVLVAAIYLELRYVRDGTGPESLAAIFD